MSLPEKETLPQLIRRALLEPRDDVLRERDQNGVWLGLSSKQLLERANNLACAIRDAGLQQGDRVALIAGDCIDWVVCDFATFFAGCVVVPIFPTQALDLTAYILDHSESKLLFIDKAAAAEHLSPLAPAVPTIVFDNHGDDGLRAFEARGAAIRAERPDLPLAYEAGITPDDLAVLIYTSGTTGQPKGVMLSHDNLGFDALSSLTSAMENLEPGADVISVLPFSHIYEHAIVYIYLLGRLRYWICHDANELLADLVDARPIAMTAVPRIFDRMLAGINAQAVKHGGVQARVVPWALRIARKYAKAITFEGGSPPLLALQHRLATEIVFKKLRARLGLNRVRYLTSGSAALHVDVAMTFLGMGIPIMQGYGLTETSPVISVNHPSRNKYGTVGPLIDGVEVRIAEDGEILTRGRNVMLGYYKDPDGSAAVLDGGWLHTGDIGELDSDGFLRITDRKKEVFKTSTGKFVAPARVEASLRRSLYVSQVMVVGDGRPYPIALVVPNWDLVRHRLELGTAPADELADREDVREFLTAQARKRTADLGTYEQIRKIIVVPREFTIEAGEMSPALKLKRRVIEEHHNGAIDQAYALAAP